MTATELGRLRLALDIETDKVAKLRAENARLREALEKINRWVNGCAPDAQAIARAALKERHD